MHIPRDNSARQGESEIAILASTLAAHQRLKGRMTLCSWDAGWRSALLRAYDEPIEVEDLTTAPTADQLVVLVTRGSCNIEGHYAGKWHGARYRVGDIGMTAPGEEARLRWRGEEAHSTLQLHLPADMIAAVAAEFVGGTKRGFQLPNALRREDPVVRNVIQAMGHAARANFPDLYADTAAHFLAAHILLHHAALPHVHPAGNEDSRLAAVDAYLHENLSSQISLDTLAAVAGLSKFHLLRMFKRKFGEPPLRHLTRLRVEAAKRRLTLSSASITEISFACGYDNPSHFAAAFRRLTGVSPAQYRRQAR